MTLSIEMTPACSSPCAGPTGTSLDRPLTVDAMGAAVALTHPDTGPASFRFGPRRGALLRGADPEENARAGTEPAVDGPGAARLPRTRAGQRDEKVAGAYLSPPVPRPSRPEMAQ